MSPRAASSRRTVPNAELHCVDERIDTRVRLWLPAAQLNRLAPFLGGLSRVRFPVEVDTLQHAVGPAPNDHR